LVLKVATLFDGQAPVLVNGQSACAGRANLIWAHGCARGRGSNTEAAKAQSECARPGSHASESCLLHCRFPLILLYMSVRDGMLAFVLRADGNPTNALRTVEHRRHGDHRNLTM